MAETTDKFYTKFTETKKGAHKKAAAKNAKKEFQKKLEAKKTAEANKSPKRNPSAKNADSQKNQKSNTTYELKNSLFAVKSIPEDSKAIIENFDNVVQGVKALNSKQLQRLPDDIRELSHQLTDQRANRRLGYMNENAQLSAYVRYYTWWNFVRLTRLFSNLPAESFPSTDGIALDLGSGPLTVISALWLARPELRKLKLTWYCLDVSANSMALGEDIYLSIVAKTFNEEVSEPWKIIRVKGSFGTQIKQKADFITCANMFNELDQAGDMPPEYQTKKYYEQLKTYGTPETKYLLVEPGVPKASRTLSLLRERFIKDNFTVKAPCPHGGECPMNGFKAFTGSQNKWCNFAFSTESAPEKLLKLSERAKLPKERATLAFISVTKSAAVNTENELLCRIASDNFKLPGYRTGVYACSRLGLTLLSEKQKDSGSGLASGDLISVKLKTPESSLPKDEKSGAVKIEL
ncbi:MAG: hypothetical protein MJ162_00530 [Treponema sp.]|nr:hypothetical protein [Treponema sp.]